MRSGALRLKRAGPPSITMSGGGGDRGLRPSELSASRVVTVPTPPTASDSPEKLITEPCRVAIGKVLFNYTLEKIEKFVVCAIRAPAAWGLPKDVPPDSGRAER
ncbi:hypothetical protein CHELA20_50425 [Hyphomicrobiales bacterium]|nr:hypothetical protein CHELA20_50425 [Hyphomicrobiales bacterium]CAH1679585.1 hypothetical protein CHELA41_24701 [Hyphomicrobiales bacterium]